MSYIYSDHEVDYCGCDSEFGVYEVTLGEKGSNALRCFYVCPSCRETLVAGLPTREEDNEDSL